MQIMGVAGFSVDRQRITALSLSNNQLLFTTTGSSRTPTGYHLRCLQAFCLFMRPTGSALSIFSVK